MGEAPTPLGPKSVFRILDVTQMLLLGSGKRLCNFHNFGSEHIEPRPRIETVS